MNRAILPNYGFEYEISGRSLPAPARALELRFATLLRLAPGWRDAAPHTGGPVDRLLPWGWSERAARLCSDAPDVSVIKRVNSKCFSHEVERALGVAVAGSAIVCNVDEVRVAVRQLDAPWILKHPFGVAGRDQIRATGWDEQVASRVAKLFATTSQAVFEPQLTILREFSAHLDCDGPEPNFVSFVALHTDRSGTFRGNVTGVQVGPSAREMAVDAAQLVMDAGYRGPLGVDGFETPDGLRVVSEINARWTFGRLAHELADSLGHDVVWHHGPVADRPPDLRTVPSRATRGAWLLPDWCDPEGVSGTWIEFVEEGG